MISYYIPAHTSLHRCDGVIWEYILTTKPVAYDADDLLLYATSSVAGGAVIPTAVERAQMDVWLRGWTLKLPVLFFRLPPVARPFILIAVQKGLVAVPPSPEKK